MSPYKFLIDNDSSSTARYFPGKRVITVSQAKLEPNALDAKCQGRSKTGSSSHLVKSV